jgi:hypothetical protein
MAALDFTDKMKEASENISNIEQMLGKGLMQPFNGTNAGATCSAYMVTCAFSGVNCR